MPLELLIEVFDNHNYVIDWIDFYQTGVRCGWKQSTIISRIEVALEEVKGREYKEEVINRLIQYFKGR